MANVVNPASASTLDECKALLEDVVTELNLSALNSSASNSEGIAPLSLSFCLSNRQFTK